MTTELFLKYVNQELDWIRYYAFHETRKQLTIDSILYDVLQSIGYTKRVISLDQRCGIVLTADKPITNAIDINDLYEATEPKNHGQNKYTALEIFWIKYPSKRNDIIINLNTNQYQVIPINISQYKEQKFKHTLTGYQKQKWNTI